MKNIISSLKVPLKGYKYQTVKTQSKNIRGKKVVSKLTMPVSFQKGIQNPVKLKKSKNTGLAMLKRACNQK